MELEQRVSELLESFGLKLIYFERRSRYTTAITFSYGTTADGVEKSWTLYPAIPRCADTDDTGVELELLSATDIQVRVWRHSHA